MVTHEIETVETENTLMTDSTRIQFETEMGPIEIEIFASLAPGTAANFLEYVDGQFYNGGRFHRTVTLDNQPDDEIRIEVIQAGINPAREPEQHPPVELERTSDTGLQHLDGTISMARRSPDSAISDFFICIGDQPSLDYGGRRNPDGQGFAAFGRVSSGMETVRRIQAAAAEGQRLMPPVQIQRARRIS